MLNDNLQVKHKKNHYSLGFCRHVIRGNLEVLGTPKKIIGP